MIQLGLSASASARLAAVVNGSPVGRVRAPSIPAKAKAVDLASSDMFASISAISRLETISPVLDDLESF